MVKVNLAGLPDALFATEMFGHVKGAFTDARQDREGRFEVADQGTIFLDEIGDLALTSQVKLLRVLQDRRFERVGSSVSRTVDVRVISATNRDLAAAIESGSFREDLFYRLNLISVHLPPLRERRADIPLLTRHYFELACRQFGRSDLSFSRSADEWLSAQIWPGNIRQLRQLIERTVLLATSTSITADDVILASRMGGDEAGDFNRPGSREAPDARTLDEMERDMIRATLARFDGHITQTAEALGISRGALYRRMEKYGLNP
jgi:DNA-binding NtrC family response regulator